MDRRQFFSLLYKPVLSLKKRDIRPPGFRDTLQDRCIPCEGLCASSCPEDIIVISDGGFPRLDFAGRGCTFCFDCVNACPSGVLSPDRDEKKLPGRVNISKRGCMAWNGVICNSCLDSCDENAIVFSGMLKPTIRLDKCTGCGQCFSSCATHSIAFQGGSN